MNEKSSNRNHPNTNNGNVKCNTFSLHPIRQYSGVKPYFRKPVEVGSFSLDGQRSYHDDRSQLRYYVEPKCKDFRFNLREGYDTYVEKDDDVKERLTHLLMWIIKHRNVFKVKDQKDDDNRFVLYLYFHIF